MEAECGGCRYFRPKTGRKAIGLCVRFPPSPMSDAILGQYPLVVVTSVCGEFRACDFSLAQTANKP